MADKTRVGILFGGRSAEHEVSVRSARSVLDALDRSKYEVTMIGIDRDGRWLAAGDAVKVLQAGSVNRTGLAPLLLDHHDGGELMMRSGSGLGSAGPVDVIFPILHGPYGEDGTVQGLLELAGIAYVGSGVLGSAVGMDKEMMKRAFRAEGLPQGEYMPVLRSRWRSQPLAVREEVERELSWPVFVKPANMGSSVGISKVHDGCEFAAAMEEAGRYDRKIVVEAGIENCREVECSVLGYEDPVVSAIGEIVPGNEFYDYEAKYVDDTSELIIPAGLRAETAERVREVARRAFLAIDASGLARVDFFISGPEERVLLNEINTMPGFTEISMYPKLWEASGIGYAELVDRLIELALQRHEDRRDTDTRR